MNSEYQITRYELATFWTVLVQHSNQVVQLHHWEAFESEYTFLYFGSIIKQKLIHHLRKYGDNTPQDLAGANTIQPVAN
jgi:hypothetical protein